MTSSPNLHTRMKQLLMTVIITIGMTAFANAQTTPSTPGTPTTPEQKKQAPQPGTTQQDTQQGWRWFDENSTRDMKLDADRTRQLRELDTRYRKEYEALGNTPWTHSDYRSLTERRNTDIQRLMTPEQYQQWSRGGNQGTPGTQGTSPNRTPGTTTPR